MIRPDRSGTRSNQVTRIAERRRTKFLVDAQLPRRRRYAMNRYYTENLSGERLREVYALAPARVQQYLEAEITHVLGCVAGTGRVLELGCGYGRVACRLVVAGRRIVGIDTARESLRLAQNVAHGSCEFAAMDAGSLAFADGSFDAVVCVQNGICAFAVDPRSVVREAVRVTRPGGAVLLSSYAAAFWPHRFDWFERQAAHGLLGPIDYRKTGNGVIACTDGFCAGTMTPADFLRLCAASGVRGSITEVDGSSVFCEIVAHAPV